MAEATYTRVPSPGNPPGPHASPSTLSGEIYLVLRHVVQFNLLNRISCQPSVLGQYHKHQLVTVEVDFWSTGR